MARRPRGVPAAGLGLLPALLRAAGGAAASEGAGPDASTHAAPPLRRHLGDERMCLEGRPDSCRDRLRDCSISSPFEACFCEDGYGAQDIKCVTDSFGYSCKFTCCLAQVGFECGPFSRENLHLLAIIGLSGLALGTGGVLLTTLWAVAGRRSRTVWLSPDDRAVESASVVRDGASLHREVPMERWCVTKADLKQLRRLVWRAVQEHRIVPTEYDPFDASDDRIGPSVYTVNEQYIKPVTLAAGKASWALMRHPEGLPCQLFVTHGWEEGVFELCDKVLRSWPMGLKHAYVCVLSNPQNLDISALISTPMESPFAKALASATHMLAVPNRVNSIYSRIWCAYEAFLAYTWRKHISTARSEVPGFWPRIVRMVFLSLSGAGAMCTIFAHFRVLTAAYPADVFVLVPQAVVGSLAFAYVVLRKRSADSLSLRIVLRMLGFAAGAVGAANVVNRPHHLTSWLFFVAVTQFPTALEADRLWASGAAVTAWQLQNGFTGHLRDARCSVRADGERIRNELASSYVGDGASSTGYLRLVDKNVADIIRMGMVSAHLRQAEELAGPLGDVSIWGVGPTSIGLIYLAMTAQQIEGGWCGGHTSWEIWFILLQGLCWTIILARSPHDRVAFATGALTFLVPPMAMGIVEYGLTNNFCATNYLTAVSVGPLIIMLSAAGPGRVARVPVFGPLLVRATFGFHLCGQRHGDLKDATS
ncbi:unnamed protein product [Prorocentrum cordatum]|uniref:EGF-like domain-containing protein n=1 Tax=Prorocentrum cordatum TaxID=2364126 RepID=A0ABN9W826_9DINO|nr:unnamed protein product [Polarella glacialis]